MEAETTRHDAASPQPRTLPGLLVDLSSELQIPARDVADVYANEVKQLTAGARVMAFVEVLAASRTRTILRRAHAHAVSA